MSDYSIYKREEELKEYDPVNKPKHYNQGTLETIDIIKDTMSKKEYEGYMRGNALKYLSRYPLKNGVEDLKKAAWYINRLIGEYETSYLK